jgi:hypothetical protein
LAGPGAAVDGDVSDAPAAVPVFAPLAVLMPVVGGLTPVDGDVADAPAAVPMFAPLLVVWAKAIVADEVATTAATARYVRRI